MNRIFSQFLAILFSSIHIIISLINMLLIVIFLLTSVRGFLAVQIRRKLMEIGKNAQTHVHMHISTKSQ